MSFPYDPDFQNSELLNGQPGACVQIHAGYSLSHAQAVVYKVLEIGEATQYLLPFAEQEAQLAIQNPSKYICRVLDTKYVPREGSRYYCIVMERLERDWFQEIEIRLQRRDPYPEKLLWDRLYPLVTTLAALQERKIAHRDIKPHNIFLKGDSSQVKLGDFGSCKIDDEFHAMQTLQGTPMYLSPKALDALRSGQKQLLHDLFKSDVYSLGMTFLHACYLELKGEWIRDITGAFRMNLPPVPYSKNLRDVLMCMVQAREEDRPDFITLVGWLGVYPDLNAVRFIAGVKCSQCASDCPDVLPWLLPCGHQLVFCATACITAFLQQDGAETMLTCRQCEGSWVNTELKAWCMQTIKNNEQVVLSQASQEAPSSDLVDLVSEVVSQAPGVCDLCHHHESVFQLCHPLCFDCALASATTSPTCPACQTRLPAGLLELLGL